MVSGTRPPRTRNKALRRTVIVLVSLLVLLLVGDRGGDLLAENLAASKLQSSQDLRNKPDVDIHGFPFLTQFASGEYDKVTVTSNDIPIGSGTTALSLSAVRVDLFDMTVTDNFSTVHVDRATASATVDLRELSRATGVDLTYVPDGRVRASKKISIFGQTVTPTVTARIDLTSSGLEFVATQANGLGSLAGDLARVSSEVFGTGVPLQGIPFDVKVTDLSVGQDGLKLDLEGKDITYRG